MSRWQQWRRWPAGSGTPEERLSTQAYIALFIHGCFQFGASMSGLFLNLYLWRLTEDLVINGIFNIVVYGIIPLAFATGGWIAKKRDRMVTYRLGIMMIALFYLAVIIAQDNVVDYYVLFGLFNGMALGLYWVGYLVLQYDVTDPRNRSRYLGINMVVFNSAGLAGPALAGFLISLFEGLRGYIITFAAASALFAVASVFSFRIPRIPSHHRSFFLHFSGRMMKRNRLWLLSLISFFVLGLFQGLMLFLPNILMFQTVGREDQVGYLTVFFALLTILTGIYIARRREQPHVRRDLFVSSLVIFASTLVLLLNIRLWSVIVFMVAYSLFAPLIVNTLTSYYYRLMDGLPLKGLFRIESVVLRETFLSAGRVISILMQVLFASNVTSSALPIILVALAATQLGIALLVKNKT
ncbi:MFS transporter [Cohnella panacarvi]|uniref:MFS transporter n=1 Tax=Cohnella panacarvi TaxID=400776 RepID=UPI00047A4E0F|nr:MFS transporter [Cohnella panacarvi]